MATQGTTGSSGRAARAAVQADVRRVAQALGHRPTKAEYTRRGEYPSADVLRLTGCQTWREAVEACGVAVALNGGCANKYGARRTRSGAHTYDSGKEARRGTELMLEERGGQITDLRRQVNVEIHIDGVCVLTYVADFVYREVSSGQIVIEDTKGLRTKEYKLKKKMIEALTPLRIREL